MIMGMKKYQIEEVKMYQVHQHQDYTEPYDYGHEEGLDGRSQDDE